RQPEQHADGRRPEQRARHQADRQARPGGVGARERIRHRAKSARCSGQVKNRVKLRPMITTAAELDRNGLDRNAFDQNGFAGASPGKIGMWIFLATDAMGFAALLTAYAVLRVSANAWPDPHQRLAIGGTALMTLALVTSSFTMTLAVR